MKAERIVSIVCSILLCACGSGGRGSPGDTSTGEDSEVEDDVSGEPDAPEETDGPGDTASEPEADAEDLAYLDTDDDGDGWSENEGDCDDADPDLNPGARETCGDGIDQDCSGGDLACYGDPVQTGRVEDTRINECSGLGWSRTQPVLWLHNDSGDSARFFGISATGSLLAVVNLAGATAQDWEDMAIGPYPGGGYAVYMADIGDNARARDRVRIFRVPEPAIDLPGAPVTLSLDVYDVFELFYPDGAHNAETFLADPATGDVYIVTKEDDGNSGVFLAPAPAAGSAVTMSLVASVTFGAGDLPGSPLATGGDISEDGTMILVRTYDHVFLFIRLPGRSIADAFTSHVYTLPTPPESQGEAIAFAPDGLAYTTVSEGVNPWIYTVSAL